MHGLYMRTHAASFWLATVLLSLSACRAPAPSRAQLEQAVYAAVLDQFFARDSARQFVLQPTSAEALRWLDRESATPPPDTAAARRRLAELGITAPDLAGDFTAANVRPDSIRLPIAARLPVSLDTFPPLTRAERDSLMRRFRVGAGFERYRRAYPGVTQVIALSRVGFSRDRRLALVYVQSQCGALCAGGSLLLLRYERGGWHLVEHQSLWVS